MAWIESHTVLLRHRKLRELARELRLKPVYLMGHFHALWHAALEQQEDGDLSAWSDELIAEASDYPGDAPQYVSLLQKHGWLDGKLLHDWLDYAGLYLTKKYGTAKRTRLVEIWAKHGRVYGSQHVVNEKRTNSEQKLLAPNLTNQPTLTNQTNTSVSFVDDGTSAETHEARRFINEHALLVWNAKLEADVTKLLAAVGWEEAKHRIDEGVAQRKFHPVRWALGKIANQERTEAAAAKPKASAPGEWAKKPYTPG